MLHLINLEIKKNKMQRYIKGVVLAHIILCSLTVLLLYTTKTDGEELLTFNELYVLNDILVRATFLIYSSVILSKVIIEEYKNRTILQLFSYPISRKKIIISKLIIVGSFAIINIAFGNIFLLTTEVLIDKFVDVIPGTFVISSLTSMVPYYLISIVMCGFVSIVPFYFGMRKKSTQAAIVSAVIISVCFCSSSGGSVSVIKYMIQTSIVGGIAILITMFTIFKYVNRLEDEDVL